ncbi:hypothetical protein [Nostoc sp. FACHB-280]|uniref:hypothetical protein n=1 Tax=Nostoc sp. FACHB-280 TaxID=2692839 RepID=UPI00168B9B69|nr:hypothetical protein [Nostoc sp. FACHB-280]MBD2494318.1 hypothetical protein [Nostoc sp. FACHB-280]
MGFGFAQPRGFGGTEPRGFGGTEPDGLYCVYDGWRINAMQNYIHDGNYIRQTFLYP